MRNEQYGARIALTSQKVAEIKQRASQLVLRLRGSGENLAGQLYTKVDKKDGKYIPNPKFVAQPNDKPVVDHVYMVPVSKIDSASLLDSEYLPEPISKMG